MIRHPPRSTLFPYTSSSDLLDIDDDPDHEPRALGQRQLPALGDRGIIEPFGDRKSTRLNSSHTVISYAVFCLKKKKQHTEPIDANINSRTTPRSNCATYTAA